MIIIGLSGPSCCGKSTIAGHLAQSLSSVCILEQDRFFLDPDQCAETANFCDLRYLHVTDFVTALSRLRDGHSISVPDIDFRTFKCVGHSVLHPETHVVVEGMTIFRIPAIFALCDLRYYLAPSYSTLEARKRDRDARERRKPAHIIEAQLAWVKAEYDNDMDALQNRVDILYDPDLSSVVNRIMMDLVRNAKNA